MSHQRNEVLMQVDNLCVTYDRPILRNVSFAIRNLVRPGVEQGQVVSLIGRSGIGKSQLFRCMAGLQQPTSGRVDMAAPLLRPVKAGDVGVVPQNYVLLRHRTIEQNLAIGLAANFGEPAPRRVLQFHADLLHDFHLSEHLKKYPHELSGGQRQRVSILQQILAGNRTILLDEPFSGLDAPMIEKVLDLLRRVSLMHELQTLVVVSHDLESALAISDTALVLGMEYTASDNQDDTLVPIPGATIVHTVDLAVRGLAFDAGIRERQEFRELVREVRSKI